MRKRKKIQYDDRKVIQQMCKAGISTAEIAQAIGVHRSSLYREYKRCGLNYNSRFLYNADVAQRHVFDMPKNNGGEGK